MTDDLIETTRAAAWESGAVLTELVVKAKEALHAGGSRRQFFANTAKLARGAAVSGATFGLMQPMAAAVAWADTVPGETAQDILNVAATAEMLAVTLYFHGLTHGKALREINNRNSRGYFQAALIQEFVHLEILQSLGGVPLAKKFYFPAEMFADSSVFLPTAGTLEDYFISAYLAAAMEFSGAVSSGITVADPVSIGLCVQIAGVECEHRALLRDAMGAMPANNRIIESALLTSVGGALAPLTPFLQPGAGGYSPVAWHVPAKADVDAIAQPFGFSSFSPYSVA